MEPRLIWAGLSLSTIPAAPGLGLGHRSGRWKVSFLHLRPQWEHGFPGGLQLLLPLLFHSRSNRLLNTWDVLVNQVSAASGVLRDQ